MPFIKGTFDDERPIWWVIHVLSVEVEGWELERQQWDVILGLDMRRIFSTFVSLMHTKSCIGNGNKRYERSSDVLANLYVGVKIPNIT